MTTKVKSNEYSEAKYDASKIRPSLVPTEIIKAIAQVREYGVAKYGSVENWQEVETERYIDALLRHTLEVAKDPRSYDKESYLPHLWHCACNLAFIIEKMYPDMGYYNVTRTEFVTKEQERDCQWL